MAPAPISACSQIVKYAVAVRVNVSNYMKRLALALLFASPCLALPDTPIAKYEKPSTLAIAHIAALVADGVTTHQFEKRGYVETGPYRFITGPKPTVRCMAIGGAVEAFTAYFLARKYPKLRILQLSLTVAHGAAAAHNATLK